MRRRKKSAQPSSSKYGCKNRRQPLPEMEANYQTKIPFSSFFYPWLDDYGQLGCFVGRAWAMEGDPPSFFISSFLGCPPSSPVISGFTPPPSSIYHRCCLAQYASPETPPATERQFYHCCEGSMRVSEAGGYTIQIASGSQALKFESSQCETKNETHDFRQDSINSFA